jgi:hypothetical protein
VTFTREDAAGVTGWKTKDANLNPTAIVRRRKIGRMMRRTVERRVIKNVCPRQRAQKGWKSWLL